MITITWMDAQGAIRTGDYWSPGPVADTAWVIPHDGGRLSEGYAVCVHRRAVGRWEQRKIDQKRSTREHHAAVLRAAQLRLDIPLSRHPKYRWEMPLVLFPHGPIGGLQVSIESGDRAEAVDDCPGCDDPHGDGRCCRCGDREHVETE